MRCFILAIALLSFIHNQAQENIKLMHYNLLNYGNYTSYCTSSNNFVDDKDAYLRTIIDYTEPDIFTVNEIDELTYYHERLLDEVMNTNGRNYYARASSISYANSYTMNMLYYDTRKFILYDEDVAQTLLRDINVYRLYYKDPELSIHEDTAFIICLVAHLKAGTGYDDEQTRAEMTENMMNYLNDFGVADNYVLMGDFNVYTGDEQAIQNVLYHPNTNIRFHDPVNSVGNWNNNPYYANVHTQSTHINSNDCAAGGGLDDRFDLILLNEQLLYGSDHYTYIDNSYKALGQDGNRFNGSVISPSNTSVPNNVANALYGMSDHLPVIIELEVDQTGVGIDKKSFSNTLYCKFNNPISGFLYLTFSENYKEKIFVEIYNSTGQHVFSKELNTSLNNTSEINLSIMKPGIYFLHIHGNKSQSIYKIIKQ